MHISIHQFIFTISIIPFNITFMHFISNNCSTEMMLSSIKFEDFNTFFHILIDISSNTLIDIYTY